MSIFSASKVAVDLSDKRILHGLDFEIERGHWIGLLGPNGAGKTTLLRAMVGLLPYSGSLLLDGHEIRDYKPRDRARRIAFVRQSHSLSFDFRVDELVLLGRSPHKSLLSVYEKADHEHVQDALALVDLVGFDKRSVSSLSGGELQRVFLAQALVQEAEILLLDEPTTHLDVHHQYEFLDRIRDFVEKGMTVVGAFHDLEIAARYSDRILVLQRGNLASSGPPTEVLDSSLIANVFQMDSSVDVSETGNLRIRYDGPLYVNR